MGTGAQASNPTLTPCPSARRTWVNIENKVATTATIVTSTVVSLIILFFFMGFNLG